MLAKRRKRLANISPGFGQRLVFDRLYDKKRWREINWRQTKQTLGVEPVLFCCWASVASIVGVLCLLRTDEWTRVNQHVPTSLWEGRHSYVCIVIYTRTQSPQFTTKPNGTARRPYVLCFIYALFKDQRGSKWFKTIMWVIYILSFLSVVINIELSSTIARCRFLNIIAIYRKRRSCKTVILKYLPVYYKCTRYQQSQSLPCP